MKAHLNIICKKELRYRVRNEIDIFVHDFDAKLVCIDEKVYWKEEKSVQFLAEILFRNYTIEKIEEEIKRIWAREDDVYRTEDDERRPTQKDVS